MDYAWPRVPVDWMLRVTSLSDGNILGHGPSAFAAVVLMDVSEWAPLITLITLAGHGSATRPVGSGQHRWRLLVPTAPSCGGTPLCWSGHRGLVDLSDGRDPGFRYHLDYD
jgi:hypothetical protein